MKLTRFFSLVFSLLLLGVNMVYAQYPLKFRSNKTFKIVQFTDVHYVPDNPASFEATERMGEVLDLEQPDLVILTGDIVYGRPADVALKKALEPVIARHLPFAITWGNHDNEHGYSRAQLMELVKTFPGNLTQTTPGITGDTNYVLSIQASQSKVDSALLYFFDSHTYSPIKQVKGYDWIKADQVLWYANESAQYTEKNAGSPLTALAFFHIPLPEYDEAVKHSASFVVGTRKEVPCAPKLNSGLYTQMLSCGDVLGVFVGHDHVNDYLVDWHGIALCYGRYTGGNTVYNNVPGGNGARIIELTEGSRSFRTWIRLKHGKLINAVDYPADAH